MALPTLVGSVEASRLESTVRTLVSFHSRHVLSGRIARDDDPDGGTDAARDALAAAFTAIADTPSTGGRLTVSRDPYSVTSRRLGQDAQIINVVGRLTGTTEPERIFIIGGHYDSINGDNQDAKSQAPGANDDGSGTAAILEACRVLASVPHRCTILFVAYDGEEMGLLGSNAHAQSVAAKGSDVGGMITNDIVGNSMGMDGIRRNDYVRVFSYAPRGNDSNGRSLARAAARASRYVEGFDVKMVFRGDRYGRGGDHRPFFAQGYPSTRFTEPREDFSRQHQNVTEKDGAPYGDLPDFMDFDYLAQVCRLDVALLGELANAPPPPESVRARGARDAYDTLLSFMPVDDSAENYAFVWRETTSPDWEHELVLAKGDPMLTARGDGFIVRLPGVCLDEVVVGVAAVGPGGHRSLVSTPPEPDNFNMRPSRPKAAPKQGR